MPAIDAVDRALRAACRGSPHRARAPAAIVAAFILRALAVLAAWLTRRVPVPAADVPAHRAPSPGDVRLPHRAPMPDAAHATRPNTRTRAPRITLDGPRPPAVGADTRERPAALTAPPRDLSGQTPWSQNDTCAPRWPRPGKTRPTAPSPAGRPLSGR